MRIFVASWFFPPVTTSEGIVAYKLLRNSRHRYDVCSSLSRQWTYHRDFPFEADNIEVFPIDTDDFDVWIDQAVRLFEARHTAQPYDAFMTRSMPPESIKFAHVIRRRHPEIPWIASLADPVAKSPYEVQGLILDSAVISQRDKDDFMVALHAGVGRWRKHWNPGIRLLCEKKDLEDFVLAQAAAVIMPHDTLRSFVLDNRPDRNTFTVPHTFDRSLYPPLGEATQDSSDGVTTLVYLGHTDELRSLEPLVRAVAHLNRTEPATLDHLRFRFIGNVPERIRTLVYSDFLHNTISIEPGVDYLDSLDIMQRADWLIHVDAAFDFLPETGGSVFFAGKLADYMGTDRPILALSGLGSPAEGIVREAGGLVFAQDDITGLARALSDIALGRDTTTVDRAYRSRYEARTVAAAYDQVLDSVLAPTPAPYLRPFWPEVARPEPGRRPFLSICVPAYKVEPFLDRCLFSMVSCPRADRLEIWVVNDGSPDNSREIARAYEQHYPGIVHLIDKDNGGHGSTINAALAVATGRYFRVVDGDDWLDSKSLCRLIERLDGRDDPPDLVSSDYLQVWAGTGETDAWTKQSGLAYNQTLDFANDDFGAEYFTMASSMVKTDLLRAADFQLQEHTYYVDVEYLLFFIPFIRTVMFTPEPLYRYTVGNADQSINPDVFVDRFDHHDRVIRRMVNYFADWPTTLPPGPTNYVKSLFVRHLLRSHYELCLTWDPNKERGCARARDFDEFLAERSPWLYQMTGRLYRGVRQARRSHFDPKLAKSLRTLESGTLPPQLRSRTKAWVKRQVGAHLPLAARLADATPVGRRLLRSDFAHTIKRRLVG